MPVGEHSLWYEESKFWLWPALAREVHEESMLEATVAMKPLTMQVDDVDDDLSDDDFSFTDGTY